MALTPEEEEVVRQMIHRQSLEKEAVIAAVQSLDKKISEFIEQMKSFEARLSRVERWQWTLAGGMLALVVGLPAVTLLVTMIVKGSAP